MRCKYNLAVWVFFILAGAAFCGADTVTVGNGTDVFSYPFRTLNSMARTQLIYHADEIDKTGYINGLSFYMETSAAEPITDFRIRLRPTTMSSYPSGQTYEVEGWTVVYSGHWPVGTGWVGVDFDVPFWYDGTDNLLVDVSFHRGSGFATSLLCRVFDSGTARMLYTASNTSAYDPQTWEADYGPATALNTRVPNLKLHFTPRVQLQRLGVMCFNIRFSSNSENDPCDNYSIVPDGCIPRRERIIEMIRNASQTFGSDGPDIIGMQEVYDRRNQVFDMINALDDQWSWTGISDTGLMTNNQGCSYNTIFYRKERFQAKDQGSFWLSPTPDVAGSRHPDTSYIRLASWVILYDRYTNRDYFVLNTHMDHTSDAANETGASTIMNKLEELAGDLPILVMGDMNHNETSTGYKIFTGQIPSVAGPIVLRDFFREIYPVPHPKERSFNGFVGHTVGQRIDFILGHGPFIAAGETIERGQVFGRYPSDHYPLTSILYVPKDLRGDLNDDGRVDLSDVLTFADHWLATGQYLTSSTVDEGLLARWSFDAPVAGIGFSENGKIDGAAVLNGIDQSIFDPTNYSGGAAYSQQLDEWAIAVWVKLDRIPYRTSADGYMMNIIGDEHKYAGSIQLSVRDNARLRLETYTSFLNFQSAYSETELLTNQWYHIAVNYSAADNTVRFYLNGQPDGVQSLTGNTLCWIGPLYIGRYKNDRWLDGKLDELRVYNRQLTGAEIAYLAAGGSAPGTVWQDVWTPASFIPDPSGKNTVDLVDFSEFSWYFNRSN